MIIIINRLGDLRDTHGKENTTSFINVLVDVYSMKNSDLVCEYEDGLDILWLMFGNWEIVPDVYNSWNIFYKHVLYAKLENELSACRLLAELTNLKVMI